MRAALLVFALPCLALAAPAKAKIIEVKPTHAKHAAKVVKHKRAAKPAANG